MDRAVTLFTGQWADLPLEKLAKKAASWGYDGLELACWGDHFDVDKALTDKSYCKAKRAMLKKYGLKVYAISTHLCGQAVCDNIDERHKAILPPLFSARAAASAYQRHRPQQPASRANS